MKHTDNLKKIDPAVLKKILGGVQPVQGKDQKTTVIAQPGYLAFYHS